MRYQDFFAYLIGLAADEYHSMSRRLLHQCEAALTLEYSLLATSPLASYAGVKDLDRETPNGIFIFKGYSWRLGRQQICNTSTMHEVPPSAYTASDCNFTARVASAMSENFTTEGKRMDKFWELLEHENSVKFQRIDFGDAKIDGSLTHPKGGLMVNIQVKNEVGSGGGAIHVQNAVYAAKYAAGQAGVLTQSSTCPTLLIELAGPNMSLSGAVFSNVVVCDQLTPMVSLLWQPHSPLMLQAARRFAALRMALPRLLAYYDSVQSLGLRQQLDFPYPTSFTASDGSGQVHFRYGQRLSCLCF